MPSIDYHGRFWCGAQSTAEELGGAIAFPVKASTAAIARRFAGKMVLELLPGWTFGQVVLTRDGECVDSWVLRKAVVNEVDG